MIEKATSVVIEYADLVVGKNLSAEIQRAYGPEGLGILFVNGIPNYVEQRAKTLPLFHQLGNLPKETLKKYKRPEVFHSQGWSHGVEQFQGKYDLSKGSYYVNCASDTSYTIRPEDEQLFTQEEKKLFSKNRWVEDIPEIQVNVRALSQIMMKVGTLLAMQIDNYIRSKLPSYPEKHLQNIIEEGKLHLGRMLHYYPFQTKLDVEDDWCGWHNDHGALTALTSALYTNEKGQEIPFQVKTGGLYAKNRLFDSARIAIPKEMLAFQIGQSSQILSGGLIEATPHCVVRSEQLAGKKISRNTFALFMQPNPLEKMKVPEGADPKHVIEKEAYKVPSLSDRWEDGIFFKEFHKRTIAKYS